jgi:hypothetical protein
VTPPQRHWRSYGTEPLPTAAEAWTSRSGPSRLGSYASPATAAARTAC